MDQEKIGKLIAKLRKSKGLTQSELGDMVGVGFRAVSKWETGQTSPDISIINDLSKILGISADELLTGEVNKKEENKKPKNRKIIYVILLLLGLITSIGLVIINKPQIYNMAINEENDYIEGEVIFKNRDITIKINRIDYGDKAFGEVVIKNYQYEIFCDDKLIFGYGYVPLHQALPGPITIGKWYDKFTVNYNSKNDISRQKIIKKGIILKITFLDEDDNEIIKSTKIKLKKQK